MLQLLQECPPPLHLNTRSSKSMGASATDPFNKAVRESLCRNWSHQAERMATAVPDNTGGSEQDIESITLSHIITGFLEDEHEGESRDGSGPNVSEDSRSDAENSSAQESITFLGQQLYQIQQGASSCSTRLEVMLLGDVNRALAAAKEKLGLSIENDSEKNSLRRFIMNSLRCRGYDAGICNSRWEKTHSYPAGDYQFIDVVVEGTSKTRNDRLFVDIDFRTQFEIARPTDQFDGLLQMLPILFVGREDNLCQVIKIMCAAARWSLKDKGMHIPPWRKFWYVKAKWMGPHKRTINPDSTETFPRARQLLLQQQPGIAPLKERGTRWNVCLNDQRGLHFAQERDRSKVITEGRTLKSRISCLATASAEAESVR
uniref:TSA: Wollemia nobilis Ref_Wollemi_Transcript_29090_1358 transcribed RNA sequence n=1 Tax=Wollemia nobilis TaxID=56998 RepID=A0A0C9RFZ1_9CONI